MELQRSVRALVVVFTLNGFAMAQVFSRMPALRDQVDASPGRLGLALLAVGVGSLVAMPWTARLTDRFGSAAVVRVSGLVNLAAWVSLAAAHTPGALTAGLFAVGLTVGVWDVSMNVQGNTLEHRSRRVLMPRLHAGFSAGTVGGSLLGAAGAATGLSVGLQFGAVALTGSVLLLVFVARLTPDAAQRPRPAPRSRRRRGLLALNGLEVVLGLLAFSTALGEGAANDWLALVLVDERGAPPAVGALTFAGFNLAMTVGRLGGGALIGRHGRVVVLRLAGAAATTGVLLVSLLPWLGAAMVGGMLWGLGLSVVFPAAMSAAGEVPGRGPHAIGVVSTIGYTGFLAGSPTIGLLADRVGLDLALLVVAGAALLVLVVASAARERAPAVDAATRR